MAINSYRSELHCHGGLSTNETILIRESSIPASIVAWECSVICVLPVSSFSCAAIHSKAQQNVTNVTTVV